MSKARELANLGNAYSDGALSNRNMVINGAMVVDQRNNGAAVTNNGFSVDRFNLTCSGDGVVIAQQSSTAPTGFNYSLVMTNTTADASVSAAEYYDLMYKAEGYDVAHLNWGTSDPSTVTLSFWVRSSSTGTFSAQIRNASASRSFVFDYTVNAVDTWQRITKTISGDTTGTWNKTNGTGINILFPVATGSNYTTSTTDAWQAGNYNASTNANTSWIGTVNNTFYITGVQLEVGDTATPFEHRSYSDQLSACMRYYWKPVSQVYCRANGYSGNGRYYGQSLTPPTIMRANPSVTLSNISYADANSAVAELTNADMLSFRIIAAGDASNFAGFNIVVDAEL